MNNLVMTGVTGFLGAHLVEKICKNYDHVYALVRPKTYHRIKESFSQYSNLQLIPGDLEDLKIFSNYEDQLKIQNLEADVLHVAAHYDISSSKSANYISNILGTQNLLHMLSGMKKVKRLHYISSVGVSGNYEGVFQESFLDKNQSFDDFYAESKFNAECIVVNWKPEVPKVIYRPGIIIGHSETGFINKIDGPYYIFQILHRFKDFDRFKELLGMSKYLPVPYGKTVHIPFVPVDEVAAFVVMSMSDKREWQNTQTYHVTGVDGGIHFETFLNEALEFFNYDIKAMPLPLSKANDFLGMGLGFPKEILSYMYKNCLYSQENLKKNFPNFKFKEFKDYRNNIYRYALNDLKY